MEEKVCTKCGESKRLDEYYKHPQSPSGRHSECKGCLIARTKKNHKTKSGLIAKIHTGQLAASRQRNHPPPSYTLDELIRWVLAQPIFHVLYDAWVKSGYNRLLIPSCDRIDSLLPYSLDNLQVVTFEENMNNGHRDLSNGIFGNTTPVTQKDQSGKILGRFKSTMEAERITGTHHEHICEILKTKGLGRRKTANGFIWEKWENPQ